LTGTTTVQPAVTPRTAREGGKDFGAVRAQELLLVVPGIMEHQVAEAEVVVPRDLLDVLVGVG
jgi:hypothetical protein